MSEFVDVADGVVVECDNGLGTETYHQKNGDHAATEASRQKVAQVPWFELVDTLTMFD